jgi:hypothetical protein
MALVDDAREDRLHCPAVHLSFAAEVRMSQQCPRCGKTLDFAGAPLSFCGYCGAALKTTTSPADPEVTLPRKVCLDDPTPPDRIGEYRLLRCLGRGGMGVVHEGVYEPTGRRVAVKLIDMAASPDALDRFRREGKLAASVTHPRCVFVLAVDEDAGRPYIVMELMPGETLEDLVRKEGPLPPGRAIDFTLDLVEGLEQVHALGIIHRDVKPSNCFLDEKGRVKVGDFGLARSLAPDARLTRTGTFVGTPLFAAPEQILGQPLDVRADVYSACATLWFLLTGRAPHDTGDGDALAALARVVADDPPPLRSLRPELPAGLERLLARGLARDRQRRLPDLATLAGSLRAFRPVPAGMHILASRATAYLLDQALLVIVSFLWPLLTGDSLLRDWTWTEEIIAAMLGAVYFGLWEGFTGLTPGKWMLGLRVWRKADVGPPGFWRALLRGAVCELLLLGRDLPSLFDADNHPIRALGLLLLIVLASLSLLLSTARRRNGYRCLHDFLSGTRVVLAPSVLAASPFAFRAPVPSADTSSAVSWVGPYRVQGAFWNEEDRLLAGIDEGLNRPVWIWERRTDGSALPPARREVVRPTRLRWLADGEQAGARWDVFVTPAGGPLAKAMKARPALEWEQARPILEALSEELTLAGADRTMPSPLCLSQVWVSPAGQVQLLDLPFPGSPPLSPLDLLAEVAVLLLEGRQRADAQLPRAPLPLFARELLEGLPRFGGSLKTPAAFHDRLTACRDRPGRLLPAMRGPLLALLALAAAFPLLLCLILIEITTVSVRYLEDHVTEAKRILVERRGQEATTAASLIIPSSQPLPRLAGLAVLMDQQRETHRLQKAADDAEYYTKERRNMMARIDHWLVDQIPEDALRASWRGPPPGLDVRINTLAYGFRGWDWSDKVASLIALMFTPVLFVLAALVFRGGLRHYLLGVRLVRRDGRRAGRFRCAWRALVAWTFLVPLGCWNFLQEYAWRHQIAYLGDLCWAASGLLALLSLALMLRTPARSLHDRLAGTWLVPR